MADGEKGMSLNELSPILQFGFAATMAYLIWRAYVAALDLMLSVVVKNSEALQKVSSVVEQSTRTTETLVIQIREIDIRLSTLEHCTHGPDGHMSCDALAQHLVWSGVDRRHPQFDADAKG